MIGSDVDNAISQQVDEATSPQLDAVQPAVRRVIRSYHINEELAYRLDVLAAQQRKKLYQVVEEAVVAYLDEQGG